MIRFPSFVLPMPRTIYSIARFEPQAKREERPLTCTEMTGNTGNLAGSSTSAERELEVDASLKNLTSHWGVISARCAGGPRRDWRRIAASQTAPANRENFCSPALRKGLPSALLGLSFCGLSEVSLARCESLRGPLPASAVLQGLPSFMLPSSAKGSSGSRAGVWRFAAHPTKAGTAGTDKNDWRAKPHAALNGFHA